MDKKRILVVDDEPELVEMIKLRLEANDYDVITAYDGEQALDIVKEKPDLILLDIIMPKIDGYEVAARLKQSDRTSSIPIIMLTAKGQVEDVEKSYAVGAIDYIVKPFDPRLLLEKIRKSLNRSA